MSKGHFSAYCCFVLHIYNKVLLCNQGGSVPQCGTALFVRRWFHVSFVLSLFVPYPTFFWCLGKAELRDCGITWISLLIFLGWKNSKLETQVGLKSLTWITLIMICYIVPWWPSWLSDQIAFSNPESDVV